MALLRDKQRKLAEVEATIAALEAKFNATVAEKEALEASIELTSNRLNRAGRLNIALGDEQTRWEDTVRVTTFCYCATFILFKDFKDLGQELANSVGDVLMAAASVAYLGAFTSNYRTELSNQWEEKCKNQEIPATVNFS